MSVIARRIISSGLEASTLSLLGSFRFSIYVFAKLGHATVLVLVIAVENVFFRSFPNLREYGDPFFNVYNRLLTKKTLSWHFELFL